MEFTTIANTLCFVRLHAFKERGIQIIPKEGKIH